VPGQSRARLCGRARSLRHTKIINAASGATTESSNSTPATPTAAGTPRTNGYEHAAQPPAEPADASTPINFDDPHYTVVGAALLEAMEEIGGVEWNPQFTAQWASAYQAVADIMMEGARQAGAAA